MFCEWRTEKVSRETLVLKPSWNFTRLGQVDTTPVGIQPVLFIGSSATATHMDFIFTPRGYTDKYTVTAGSAARQTATPDQEAS